MLRTERPTQPATERRAGETRVGGGGDGDPRPRHALLPCAENLCVLSGRATRSSPLRGEPRCASRLLPCSAARGWRSTSFPQFMIRLYNSLSQRCFSDCVVTFYRKTLGKREAECVKACVRKYLLLTTASAARFAELADSSSSAAAASDD